MITYVDIVHSDRLRKAGYTVGLRLSRSSLRSSTDSPKARRTRTGQCQQRSQLQKPEYDQTLLSVFH